jgi:micrococcal nuclease
MYTYNATVIRVVDGDTLILNIDLGFRLGMKLRGRLANINAPEGKQTEATAWLTRELPVGAEVVVQTKKTQEKFGRWIITVFIGNRNLNQELLDLGLALPYVHD